MTGFAAAFAIFSGSLGAAEALIWLAGLLLVASIGVCLKSFRDSLPERRRALLAKLKIEFGEVEEAKPANRSETSDHHEAFGVKVLRAPPSEAESRGWRHWWYDGYADSTKQPRQRGIIPSSAIPAWAAGREAGLKDLDP